MEESISAGEVKVTPHIPYFCRDGNTVIRQWTEKFDDGHGHTGVMTMILFKNKKGVYPDPVMRYIKWDN